MRATDLVGRYGGEEIAVVLTQTHCEGAKVCAEGIRRAIEEAHFEVPGGKRLQVTVSVGVAAYEDSMKTAADFIAVADEALYRAKRAGRNRVEG